MPATPCSLSSSSKHLRSFGLSRPISFSLHVRQLDVFSSLLSFYPRECARSSPYGHQFVSSSTALSSFVLLLSASVPLLASSCAVAMFCRPSFYDSSASSSFVLLFCASAPLLVSSCAAVTSCRPSSDDARQTSSSFSVVLSWRVLAFYRVVSSAILRFDAHETIPSSSDDASAGVPSSSDGVFQIVFQACGVFQISPSCRQTVPQCGLVSDGAFQTSPFDVFQIVSQACGVFQISTFCGQTFVRTGLSQPYEGVYQIQHLSRNPV